MIIIEKLNIRLLIIEKDKEPYEMIVKNRLEHFRKLLGAENLEVVLLDIDSLLIFDGDAIKKDLQVNRMIDGTYKIRGTFIITGNDEKNEDFTNLSNEQIRKYKYEFQLKKELELDEEIEI